MDFISQTKNFYEDFEFNISMFKEIKTNFFEFFCIDKNKFYEKLKKKNTTIFKKTGVNNIYNLKKEDDAFIIFKTISYEKVFELRDISKLESFKNEHIIIKDKISKSKIIKMIPEFSKLIEEYGLDCEWYQNLANLNERLSIKEIKKEEDDLTNYSKNMISLGYNTITKKYHKNTLTNNSSTYNVLNQRNYNKENTNLNSESVGRRSYSSISITTKRNHQNNNEENFSKKLINNNNNQNINIIIDGYFDVIYNLKKLGNIHFYIVDLYEKILYKYDETNSLLYEPKFKFSFSKKKFEESFKMSDKNISNKFIKAKTLFSGKNRKSKNFNNFNIYNNPNVILIGEKMEDGKREIETKRTWASDNNIINMKKHLIKEGERIFNRKTLMSENKADKLSVNSNENKKNNSTISMKNRKNNFERINKKEGTKKKLNDASINNNFKSFNHYSILKQKDKEDEDKISFLTKDSLEEYLKKNNKINKFFIFIIFVIFLLIVVIVAIKLGISRSNFSFTSYLTNGMIFIQEIKSDLFMGSIIVLSQCYRSNAEDIPFGMSGFPVQLYMKSADLLLHLNVFEKQLKLTKNNKLLSNIMKLLYKSVNISYLNPDWTRKIEESYLLKEINYFSYLLIGESGQMRENINCNFENNFYILFITNETLFTLNDRKETTFNQQFIYYIIFNVFYKLSPILNEIIEELVIVQVKTMNNYMKIIVAICIILIFLIILEEVFIILKIRLDIYFIRQIIIFLYHYDKTQLQFEYEIKYLEITSKEFNLNNLTLLENIKNDNDYYLNLININNPNEILNNNVESHHRESLNRKTVKIKLDEKDNNKVKKKGDGYEQNSLNGSLFNNSMLQLLNKKKNKDEIDKLKEENKKQNKNNNDYNNNKKKLKNKSNNNAGDINDDKIFRETEETLGLLKTNNKILPRTLFLSIYISIIFTLFFLATISLNLIDINKKRNVWEYGINLSMNYLEKIPKLTELGLYLFLTVILNIEEEENYYPIDIYQNYQARYLTYFTQMKRYDNSELISSSIKDSVFANKLYDNYRIKKNIEFCENDEFFKKYFLRSKNNNKKLNEKNKFCINSALLGVLFFNKWITTLDTYTEYADLIASCCLDENDKISESGLDLEIDLILHELTYLFNEFEARHSNITLARQKFFENEIFIRMLKDMNIPLTFASGALFSSVNNDLNALNSFFSYVEMIFIVVTYIIDALFFCFLIFMISNNEKNKNILYYIQKILKKE